MVAHDFKECVNSIKYFDAPERYKSQTWLEFSSSWLHMNNAVWTSWPCFSWRLIENSKYFSKHVSKIKINSLFFFTRIQIRFTKNNINVRNTFSPLKLKNTLQQFTWMTKMEPFPLFHIKPNQSSIVLLSVLYPLRMLKLFKKSPI